MNSLDRFVSKTSLPSIPLWKKMEKSGRPFSFDLEVTARCNNNCRHCCINLPAGDRAAKAAELSPEEIREIAEEAVALGAVWCLLTGGEPLFRDDFFDIYLHLKKLGLLVSVFTNASLIQDEHVKLWKKYPPRDIEVTVYGVTPGICEAVTRTRGSFGAAMRGLDLLRQGGVPVRLKAMALKSNASEFPAIARFCRERTKDFFRFDPFLHLRYDGDPMRSREIAAERLSPREIVAVERSDSQRMSHLKKVWQEQASCGMSSSRSDRLFQCGAGKGHFVVSCDGRLRLCPSLWHPDCLFDLRAGSLSQAWHELVPKVRSLKSRSEKLLERCRACTLIDFCSWCPANAHLEAGGLEAFVEYFCAVAHARAEAVETP